MQVRLNLKLETLEQQPRMFGQDVKVWLITMVQIFNFVLVKNVVDVC